MKRVIKKVLFGMVCLCVCLGMRMDVHAADNDDADVYGYVTQEFNVTAEFDESHTATITEEIKIDFTEKHHGIKRNIPIAKDRTYELKNISVEDYKYKVEKSGNNKVIKIGDADKYLTGEHTFVIHYQIVYYADDNASVDYLAQNLLPTEWDTPIQKATVKLKMPSEVDWNDMKIYAGTYGEDDPDLWEYYFSSTVEGNEICLEGTNLAKGFGLTIVNQNLQNEYWSQAVSFTKGNVDLIVLLVLISVILMGTTVFLWFRYGRDDKIVETVEFYPPDGLTPVEIGYAIDEELDDREMMSMLFYLADKRYLSIKTMHKQVTMKKLKSVSDEEPNYVKTFLSGFFPGNKKSFDSKDVPKSFYKRFCEASEEVKKSYEQSYGEVFTADSFLMRGLCAVFMVVEMLALSIIMEGWSADVLPLVPAIIAGIGMFFAWKSFDNYRVNPRKSLVKIIAGGLLFVIGNLVMKALLDDCPMRIHLIIYAITEAVLFGFSLIMQKRSVTNVQLMGKIYGFRRFIKEAEYDRLVTLSQDDPEYYYHILPYAMILGLETTWTKHFEQLMNTNRLVSKSPSWYSSAEGLDLLDDGWRYVMIHSYTTSRSEYNASHSGGSSGGYSGGSSGGGFSGGGGGGGGGGAW